MENKKNFFDTKFAFILVLISGIMGLMFVVSIIYNAPDNNYDMFQYIYLMILFFGFVVYYFIRKNKKNNEN